MRQRSRTIAAYSFPLDWTLEERNTWQDIRRAAQQAKEEGKRIVLATGVFDLFHVGHLNMFKRAKEQCRYLIVGVVSDEGVRLNKQAEPFVPFEERNFFEIIIF